MRNAFAIIGNKRCTGCFGCQNVCHFEAISMHIDHEGFYKPLIDESKCTECGVCENRCPVITYTNPNRGNPKTYAGWSKDSSVRINSSSGGVFSELAIHVIQKYGGVVFGVMWSDGLVRHSYTETVEGLSQFRGSKYLPSNVNDAYNQVKQFIKDGRKVLFSGVPCQVAALRNIVKSDNLILVDLACLGVPSITVYKKYVSETFPGQSITHTNFRSKTIGWKAYSVEYWSNGYLVRSNLNVNDLFLCGFSPQCLYFNEACYECKFNAIPRCGDITLADYWGVPKELDNKLGVSAIFTNNEKADKLLKEINATFLPQPLEQILDGTPRLNRSAHVKKPKNRTFFFIHLEDKSFDELAKLYYKRSNKIVLLFVRIIRKFKKIVKHI